MAEVIGGAWFTMGSDETQNEQPPHQVILTCFYIGKHEITQKEYYTVMGTNPAAGTDGDNFPVVNVSWYDAVEFCNELSDKDGLTRAYVIDKAVPDPENTNGSDLLKWTVTLTTGADGYRLPTEAEWEYACRAGTTRLYSLPSPAGEDTITTVEANYNSAGTQAAGNYNPNNLGIFDMHGNVWEWCWDWYAGYSGNREGNPLGPNSGGDRVRRGGSWKSVNSGELRSAYRESARPDSVADDLGFRVIRPKYPEGIP